MNAPRSPPPAARLGAAPVPGGDGRRKGGRAGKAGGGAGRGALQTPSCGQGRGLSGTRLPVLMPAAAAASRQPRRGRGSATPGARAGQLGAAGAASLDDLTGGGEDTDRLSTRSRGRAADGGAPATVTGTNKEVLCARAAAPHRGPRPAPAAAAPPPPARCLPGHLPTRARGRPQSADPSELFTPGLARRGTKKSCARSFLVSCGCRKPGRESRLLLRGAWGGLRAGARSRPGARTCSCSSGSRSHSLCGALPAAERLVLCSLLRSQKC